MVGENRTITLFELHSMKDKKIMSAIRLCIELRWYRDNSSLD